MDTKRRILRTIGIVFFVLYVLMVLLLPVLDTITRIVLIGLLLLAYAILGWYGSGKLVLSASTRKIIGVPAALILSGVGINFLSTRNYAGLYFILMAVAVLAEAFGLRKINQP